MMPTFTGVVFIDWLIFAAAGVTAVWAIYMKGLLPLWRVGARVRRTAVWVENVREMSDDFPPATRAAILSANAAAVSRHDEVMAELAQTNKRIDDHMVNEEQSIQALTQTVAEHMAADTAQTKQFGQALQMGQELLLGRLESIETKLAKLEGPT